MSKKTAPELPILDDDALSLGDSEEALPIEPEPHAPPERVFAMRIIQMALFDFCSDDALNRTESERMLLNGGAWFEMICDCAGLSATSITAMCLSYQKNPEFLRMLRQRVFKVIL